ncbi:TonB-dependent siderophore receptor [Desulfobacula sp.]|uniref:TonB-dependent receptor plug domain-containing protein n=1 Tax=Desulfobacula sp. TaxID=2593537 RepID=UPI0025BCF3EE|nr:TonB-dependent receptor plug domain-containing protein [Desulfobacula sp.]
MGKKSIVILLMVLLLTGMAGASDTMLMFVGEDLEVISIASRREEAAWSAPAIADVITREDLKQKGAFTLSQALEDVPGFYMNKTEKGSIPYLRGIPNSALFLFDTLPMGSGVKRSDTMIDYETSLAPVKRIEIVQGAGSVLWGPDAFAGVVNTVPMSGRDFQGVETGLILSSEDAPGEAYINYGRNEKKWSSFLSVSGRTAREDDESFKVVKFWNDVKTPEPIETRYGQGTPGDSQYVNLYAAITYDDWLTLSAKISDSKKAYTISDWDQHYLWEEKDSAASYVYKLELSKKFTSDSGIRFTGYYSQTCQDHLIVDRELDQKESSLFGEIIYDQSLFHSKGLMTMGASWRRDQFDRMPVWESFFPDFLVPANLYFLPRVDQIDFENNLASVFTQYRHEFGDIEVWAGVRYDDHDAYEDKTSYNTGFAWNMGDFMLKSIYGTAYRSPFARQLQETGGNKLEKIDNINAQLSWKKSGTQAAVTVFRNKIENHVIEDRYAGAGLSTPNSQTIDGAELELARRLTDNFKLSCNLTLLDNSGPDEMYLYNDYTYIDKDGSGVKHYQKLEYAYDTGPDIMGMIKGAWSITDQITLVSKLRYFSRRKLYYPMEDITRVCDPVWIMDANLLVKEIFPFDLSIYLNNIFNKDYSLPGIYSITRNPSFNAGLMIRMNW